MVIADNFESPACTMTMPQLDTDGFGLLRDGDSAQKEFCSGGELSSAPSPPLAPSYIMKFTIDYTDVIILFVILIILCQCCPIRIERNTAVTREWRRRGRGR